MTEPSKQARDLLNRMQRYATFNEPRSVLELIDAALAEARGRGLDEGARGIGTYVDALHAGRAETERLTRERDELAATVERVRALADEWDSDTEFAHKAHYADELRDALDGGESDE